MDKTHLSSYVNLFENVLTIPRVAATTTTMTTTKKLTNSQADESFCQICYRDLGKTNSSGDDNSLVMMLKLHECGHVFCIECWSFHFQSILSSAASSAAFECMQTKCKSIADKEFVLKCLEFGGGGDQTSAYKYRVLLAKDLVKESEDLQICPGEKDESESESSLVQNYTGTPQMTMTPRIGTATASSNSNIRLISTISSTPTISFSYVRKPNGTGTTTTTSATPSTPQFSSITSTPTLTNTPQRPQGIWNYFVRINYVN